VTVELHTIKQSHRGARTEGWTSRNLLVTFLDSFKWELVLRYRRLVRVRTSQKVEKLKRNLDLTTVHSQIHFQDAQRNPIFSFSKKFKPDGCFPDVGSE
jgi:hypothetical protein